VVLSTIALVKNSFRKTIRCKNGDPLYIFSQLTANISFLNFFYHSYWLPSDNKILSAVTNNWARPRSEHWGGARIA
jgi:hypothetical protein